MHHHPIGHQALGGAKAFTAESGAIVCYICGKDRQCVLSGFGTREVVLGTGFSGWFGAGTVFPQIPGECRVPDFGLHGVVRVLRCGLSGVVEGLVARRGMSGARARAAIQEICDHARLASGCRSKGDLQGEDPGQELRLECGAGVWLMRGDLWKECVELLGEWEGMVGGWFRAFHKSCQYIWQENFFNGQDLEELGTALVRMGELHRKLGWGFTMWAHMWIDHMFAYASKWLILSVFTAHRMEGSHRRLKAMLRNSGGTGWMGGKLGLQTVVDNHTLDDALHGEGYDVTTRGVGKGNVAGGKQVSRKRRWSKVGW